MAYGFDDILLKPVPSDIDSREDPDTSVYLREYLQLEVPIIASPMKGIVSPALIKEVSRCGGLGIMHRFVPFEEYRETLKQFKDTQRWGAAIGLGEDGEKFAREALDAGAKVICIDVANGYLKKVRDFTENVRNLMDKGGYKSILMSGNVATMEGFDGLAEAGAEMIRVGVGSGKLCTTTTEVTGVGVPQVSAVYGCLQGIYSDDVYIVSDGGIRNSSDAVKALAVGADLVMIGSLFGSTFESDHDGEIYGMASAKLQEEYYHNSIKSIEGVSEFTRKTASVCSFMEKFMWGVRSAMTYLNAWTIKDLQDAEVILVRGEGYLDYVMND